MTRSAPASFAKAFDLREEIHPDGRWPARVAFTSGHCDAMAVALQRRMGGELVMLLEPDDYSGLVHVGVHRNGVISDVDGHFPAAEWVEAWSALYSPKATLDLTHATIPVVEELMNLNTMREDERLIDDRRISIADPLASALSEAVDLDPRVWRIATERRIPERHELPANADEAWAIAMSSSAKRHRDPIAIGSVPDRDAIHWGSIPLDQRVINERGRVVRAARTASPLLVAAAGVAAQGYASGTTKGPKEPDRMAFRPSVDLGR